VKQLGGGVTQITAVIANEKLIPTHSVADVRRKITRPDIVSLDADNAEVLVALTAEEPYFKTPTEQRHKRTAVKVDTIPSNGARYVRWLVRGEGPFEVRVDSVKGGSDAKKCE
jgi:hypothetical protein